MWNGTLQELNDHNSYIPQLQFKKRNIFDKE